MTFVPLVGVPDVLGNGILMLTRTNHLVFPNLGIRRRVHIARTTMTTTLISNLHSTRNHITRKRNNGYHSYRTLAQLLLEPPDEKKAYIRVYTAAEPPEVTTRQFLDLMENYSVRLG